MPCPICDQKPMNCDCTPLERQLWSEMQELQDAASTVLTAEERGAIRSAIGWIESPSIEDEAMPDDYLPITNVLRALLERTK